MRIGLNLPPYLALGLSAIVMLYFVVADCRRRLPVSQALWIPVIWIILAASRPLEQWFSSPETYVGYEEGSVIERVCFSTLIFIGCVALYRRRERLCFRSLIAENMILVLLVGYYGLAVLWSDFPYVAFKRYVKFLGIIIMGLVILAEPNPVLSLRTALRRGGYVLVILSVVMMKYFPEWGVEFNVWTGERMVVGIAQDKNMLGQICLVVGLLFFWNVIVKDWKIGPVERYRWTVIADMLMLLLSIQLLIQADSKTSLVALGLGLMILVSAGHDLIRRRIGTYLGLALIVGVIFVLSTDLIPALAQTLGRDPTLTNRTAIWEKLIDMANSHLWFGRGFKSFWTTELINVMRVNEAHNGYLEIILDTGLVGLSFFCLFLLSAYRHHRDVIQWNPEYGRFTMGFFCATLLYNIAEASFSGLFILFFVFITTSIRVPKTFSETIKRVD